MVDVPDDDMTGGLIWPIQGKDQSYNVTPSEVQKRLDILNGAMVKVRNANLTYRPSTNPARAAWADTIWETGAGRKPNWGAVAEAGRQQDQDNIGRQLAALQAEVGGDKMMFEGLNSMLGQNRTWQREDRQDKLAQIESQLKLMALGKSQTKDATTVAANLKKLGYSPKQIEDATGLAPPDTSSEDQPDFATLSPTLTKDRKSALDDLRSMQASKESLAQARKSSEKAGELGWVARTFPEAASGLGTANDQLAALSGFDNADAARSYQSMLTYLTKTLPDEISRYKLQPFTEKETALVQKAQNNSYMNKNERNELFQMAEDRQNEGRRARIYELTSLYKTKPSALLKMFPFLKDDPALLEIMNNPQGATTAPQGEDDMLFEVLRGKYGDEAVDALMNGEAGGE